MTQALQCKERKRKERALCLQRTGGCDFSFQHPFTSAVTDKGARTTSSCDN